MTGRPRLPDPTGERAKTRARIRLNTARRLMDGQRVPSHGDHHSGMALLKELLGDFKPKACHCGDEQVTLSLVGTAARYIGYHSTSKAPYVLSTDPNDYEWECQQHNELRGHPTSETNAGMDPALD